MARTCVSVLKIAGSIVPHTEVLFRNWMKAAQIVANAGTADPLAEGAIIENEVIIKQIDVFLWKLNRHRDRPPVLFYTEFMDPWTVALGLLVYRYLSNNSEVECLLVRTPAANLILIKPRSWIQFSEFLEDIVLPKLEGQTEFEERFFFEVLKAVSSYWEQTLSANEVQQAVLVSFRSLDATWFAEEVIDECSILPEWFNAKDGGSV